MTNIDPTVYMINVQINRHTADVIMYLHGDLDFSSYFKMMLTISIDVLSAYQCVLQNISYHAIHKYNTFN